MNYVFKKLTLILFLLFFITSCGKNSQSKAHIKISLGNMTGIYSGGLFLSGKNIDTGEAFSDVITTLDFTKMISSGSWQFYAIMWTGANELTGSPKCANPTLVNISGDQATVNLHLTLADCMSPHYALNNSYYIDANLFYDLYVNLCPSSMTFSQLLTNGNCSTSYTGMATGVRIKLHSFDSKLGINFSRNLESSCYAISNGSSSAFKLPTFPRLDGQFPSSIEVYYSSTYPSCSGPDCCQGRMQTYLFPQSISIGATPEAAINKNSSIYLIEKIPPLSLKFSGIATTAPIFKACQSLSIDLEDSFGSQVFAQTNITTHLNCNGTCLFFSDLGCSSAITQATISSGQMNKLIYVKPVSSQLTLINDGQNTEIAGDAKNNLPVIVTWSSFDNQYVFPLFPINGSSITPFAIGDVIAYQTYEGNRGKMKINSVSTTNISGDTINFDFTTWDASGNVIRSDVNITSLAASSGGTCLGDLDLVSGNPTYGTNAPGQTDFWWQNFNGSLYFNPQGSASFFKVSP